MKILYVSAQHMQPGEGSFTHVREVVSGLEGRGHDVSLLIPNYRSVRPGLLYRLGAILALQVRLVVAMVKGADVVYVRSHTLLSLIPWTCRRLSLPVALEINGPPSDLFDAWPVARWFRGLISKASTLATANSDIVICVTQEIRDYLCNTGVPLDKCVVVQNGANTDLFVAEAKTDACKRLGLDSNRVYLCFIGAMAKWQGMSEIIEASRIIVAGGRSDDWQILFAGGGECEQELLEAEKELPVIKYFGRLPQPQVVDVINASAAGIVAQTSSGRSPLKMFEYMACQRAVITTDIPASKIVAEHSAGIVVPTGDPAALAIAIGQILNDQGFAVEAGTRGYAAVIKEYSWKAVSGRVERVLQGLLLEKRRRACRA